MDGVLCDFLSPILAVHNRAELLLDWPRGEADFAKVVGMSRDDFWQPVYALGSRFWADFEPYPWFTELMDVVQSTAPFTISTAPSRFPGCASGKIEWLRRHVNPRFMDFMIGPQKHLLARPATVLIDDSESKVDEFRAQGGAAILFPQPWNRNHAISDRIRYLRDELMQLTGAGG